MSRRADIMDILPAMLTKFDESKHSAIVETFSDMLEEGWDDDDIKDFLSTGKGFSTFADIAIKKQLQCWGIDS